MPVNGPVEERLIQATVHGRVLVTGNAPGSSGVLVGFHGYAESAAAQMQRLRDIPGAGEWLLVAVQGLNRFYRGRSEDVVAGWMTRQDRETAIADNIRYVNGALDAVLGPDVEPERPLVHVGYSQGAAMAFRAAVRGRRGGGGVIAVGGDVPPELLEDPSSRFPPVLLVRGDRDEWYTADRLDRDLGALAERGVPVRASVFQGAHEWHEAVGAFAADFLREVSRRV